MKWEYGTRHRRTRIVRRRLFLGIVAILVILLAGYAVMHFGPDDLKSALRKPFLKLQDPNGEGINPEGVTETGWQTEFLKMCIRDSPKALATAVVSMAIQRAAA